MFDYKKAAEFAAALGYRKMTEEGRISEKDVPETVRKVQKELEGLGTINDGTNDVPYYGIDPVPVTAENIDEVIIGSDFHTEEDVYLNVRKMNEKDDNQ